MYYPTGNQIPSPTCYTWCFSSCITLLHLEKTMELVMGSLRDRRAGNLSERTSSVNCQLWIVRNGHQFRSSTTTKVITCGGHTHHVWKVAVIRGFYAFRGLLLSKPRLQTNDVPNISLMQVDDKCISQSHPSCLQGCHQRVVCISIIRNVDWKYVPCVDPNESSVRQTVFSELHSLPFPSLFNTENFGLTILRSHPWKRNSVIWLKPHFRYPENHSIWIYYGNDLSGIDCRFNVDEPVPTRGRATLPELCDTGSLANSATLARSLLGWRQGRITLVQQHAYKQKEECFYCQRFVCVPWMWCATVSRMGGYQSASGKAFPDQGGSDTSPTTAAKATAWIFVSTEASERQQQESNEAYTLF